MVDYDEQRGFRRMTIDCEVEVHSKDTATSYAGRGNDLSATGVQFYTDQHVSEGEQLEISIQPGKAGMTLPFHALVEVVRVEQRGRMYTAGCKILSMIDD